MYADDYSDSPIPMPGIYHEDDLTVLVADRDAGIIGDDYYEDGSYTFMRFICLPMDKIDDLDLVGTEYWRTTKERYEKKVKERHNKSYAEGVRKEKYKPNPYILVLADDDPRRLVRYDADHFFARFAKYGVTRTLPVPDIKEGEHLLHWDNDKWGTKIFIFPLDQSNE